MASTYRPRLWHLLVVALIGVFDLGVLYMVLHPRVADDYRNYYIDRSWSCFPRLITGYYPLGEPISFVPGSRNGYERDSVRWCGFMPLSSTGIRSFGDYGILRLRFTPPENEPLLLTFSSWVNFGKEMIPRDVELLVNGDRIATVHYPDPKRVNGRYVIPEAVVRKGNGIMEIKFDVPRTGPPGTNSEPVTLQLRLEALRVAVLSQEVAFTPGRAPTIDDTLLEPLPGASSLETVPPANAGEFE
jgi:hypothetical protein